MCAHSFAPNNYCLILIWSVYPLLPFEILFFRDLFLEDRCNGRKGPSVPIEVIYAINAISVLRLRGSSFGYRAKYHAQATVLGSIPLSATFGIGDWFRYPHSRAEHLSRADLRRLR